MLDLRNVTYFLADGRPVTPQFVQDTARIVAYATEFVRFKDVVVACPTDPKIRGVRWVEKTMTSMADYNKFCLREMASHIDSEFVLVFQHDGFITNPSCWSNEFFDYDYLGAPLPHLKNMVGNGGFSLRSRRMLEEAATLWHTESPEDYVLCAEYREVLERKSFKWAPIEVAKRFAYEDSVDFFHNACFCFGRHRNMCAGMLPDYTKP